MTQPPQDPNQPQDPSPGWGRPTYGPPDGTEPGYPGPVAPVPYADWLKRVGAYLVDVALLVPGYLVMLLATPMMGRDSGALAAIGFVIYLAGLLATVGVGLWNLVFRQGRTGWSVGKQVIGIRLIGERTGEPLGPGLTFVRALCHVLDQLPCYLGFLWPLWDAKRQTFADKIMSSVVVVAPRPPA